MRVEPVRQSVPCAKIPLVMRYDYLGDLVFSEGDVTMTPSLRDSSFNNHDLIESGAIFKKYADYLIAHTCFGLARKF